MKLRTFEGEPVTGELTTEYSMTLNGIPVLLVNGESLSPEEAVFFLETAPKMSWSCLKRVGMTFRSGRDEEYGKNYNRQDRAGHSEAFIGR